MWCLESVAVVVVVVVVAIHHYCDGVKVVKVPKITSLVCQVDFCKKRST